MKSRPQLFAPAVAFDGACLKLRRVAGRWRCEPLKRIRRDKKKFARHPRSTAKKG